MCRPARAAGGGCRRRAPPPSSRSGSWRSAHRRSSRPPAHPRTWRRPRLEVGNRRRGRQGASWRRARPGRRRAPAVLAASQHRRRGASGLGTIRRSRGDFSFRSAMGCCRRGSVASLKIKAPSAGKMRRARSRSSGVLTSTGTVSTIVTSMRMPSSSARSCSSCSRFSSARRLQRNEPLERGASVGIHAEVMVERAVAVGRGRAREVERPQPAGHGGRRADDLDRVGSVRSPGFVITAAMVAMSAPPCRAGARGRRATMPGSSVGRSPCRLRMNSKSPVGIDAADGLEHAVGARDVVGARHDGFAACRAHGRHDLASLSVATTTRPALGRHGAPPHMHDHAACRRCRPAACRAAASPACGRE